MRTVVLVAAVLASALALMWGARGLEPFGPFSGAYGQMLDNAATAQRHVLNVATAINFDYRGFDTLIEEYIFFGAVCGISMLFRFRVGDHEKISDHPARSRPLAPQADGIGLLCYVLLPVGLSFAVYVAAHVTVTPGGGFQAGAIAGSAFALVYLGLHYQSYRRFLPERAAEALDSLGSGGYALTGAATAIASGTFLQNVLPFGSTGTVASGGTIAVVNAFVFVEIAAGFFVALLVFFQQTRKRKGGG